MFLNLQGGGCYADKVCACTSMRGKFRIYEKLVLTIVNKSGQCCSSYRFRREAKYSGNWGNTDMDSALVKDFSTVQRNPRFMSDTEYFNSIGRIKS